MQDQINCGVYVELQRYGDEIQKDELRNSYESNLSVLHSICSHKNYAKHAVPLAFYLRKEVTYG